MKTHLPKVNVDERKWHVIDADGAVLGRLAVQVANILRGKNRAVYTPHLDAGGFVVVINAEKVRVTGKKETDRNICRIPAGRVARNTRRSNGSAPTVLKRSSSMPSKA
jgi:ribosomal protein L13